MITILYEFAGHVINPQALKDDDQYNPDLFWVIHDMNRIDDMNRIKAKLNDVVIGNSKVFSRLKTPNIFFRRGDFFDYNKVLNKDVSNETGIFQFENYVRLFKFVNKKNNIFKNKFGVTYSFLSSEMITENHSYVGIVNSIKKTFDPIYCVETQKFYPKNGYKVWDYPSLKEC